MSQILILELNDQTFAAINRQAANIGISTESLAAELLEQKFSQVFRLLQTDSEKAIKRSNFELHFGEIDLGFATDLDNESIDADLAKEYASTHEEG